MKLINLLIRELDNCNLGGDFRGSRHDEICQFDRFSLEINFKEHIVVIMEFPDWIQQQKRNFRPKGDGRSSPWASATREKLNIEKIVRSVLTGFFA